MARWYRTALLDHLGLVAGMYDELGIGEGLDRTTPPTPETRCVTVGHAVNAMVRNGLGFVHQPRYRVPRFFQHTPTPRLVAPGLEAPPRHEETLGRAWDTRYAAGVTDLYRLLAVTAAHRLGLTPTVAHLDRPSFQVDGRDHRGEAPDAQVMQITRGDRRAQRPDRTHVLRDVLGEHPAGIPVWMKPLSGHPSETRDCGQGVTAHVQPRQSIDGTTSLVADRALSSAANRQQLADTGTTGMTRVPAPLTEAPHAVEQAPRDAM